MDEFTSGETLSGFGQTQVEDEVGVSVFPDCLLKLLEASAAEMEIGPGTQEGVLLEG